MQEIGTYKNIKTYELTRQEYIKGRYYENDNFYFVISDDGFTNRSERWKLLVIKNTVVGAVKYDNGYIDTDVEQRVYYTRPVTPKINVTTVESIKIGDSNWDKGSVTVMHESGFDVDKYLAAAHSVDKYLDEMKNATYS